MNDYKEMFYEARLCLIVLLPFALYGFYRFLKWVKKMDKKNGMDF